MSRLISVLRRRAALALLPLSIVPFVGVAPLIMDSHAKFNREHNMGPLPATVAGLSAAERARFGSFDAPQGHVPVLSWHDLGARPAGWATTRHAFARQVALLKHLGYTTINTKQWADFRAGTGAPLPAKPVLLTFDGGLLTAYRAADKILARNGMHAATFVDTGRIESGDPKYLTWTELHRMAKSGRWDVEPRAHEGDSKVTVSPDGKQAPFYAARRYTRSQGLESLASWEARVSDDLFTVRKTFINQGLTPHVFAVPFGDYGQDAGNDPAIPHLLRGLLKRQFGNFFAQAGNDPGFTAPGDGAAPRFAVQSDTSLDQLYRWLHQHSMAPSPIAPSPHSPTKR